MTNDIYTVGCFKCGTLYTGISGQRNRCPNCGTSERKAPPRIATALNVFTASLSGRYAMDADMSDAAQIAADLNLD